MVKEKNNQCNSKCNNCYAIIALSISIFTLGLFLGNLIGKCSNASKKYNVKKCKSYQIDNDTKKCKSYQIDGTTGSTCNWSKNTSK